ncbi:RNA-binding protein [Leptolyngbya sp. FACHB-541]|uniref:RNA recognition motif domain-containing protein n=1 Tax=Leptolyngbya sp. FACHB-541 TaxID=2692810 RepID=UPI001682CA93|nr:RNA-binding protein [Leptolyngbya sp. FACHB-541]MBD1996700.1 RNA-binding protein [Leptolyngbya sp. FACHB-541]
MSIRLYVGNLPRELERQELETVFAEFDDSVSTKVITDRKTGKCRGFGFVTVKNDEQADQLIEKFNGFVLKDSALKIEKALPRSKGKDEGDASEAESNAAPVSAKRSKGSGGGGGGKSKRPAAANSSDPEAVQPDPRWAQDLEKLKQLLATQTANS